MGYDCTCSLTNRGRTSCPNFSIARAASRKASMTCRPTLIAFNLPDPYQLSVNQQSTYVDRLTCTSYSRLLWAWKHCASSSLAVLPCELGKSIMSSITSILLRGTDMESRRRRRRECGVPFVNSDWLARRPSNQHRCCESFRLLAWSMNSKHPRSVVGKSVQCCL
jgi:hypothetical protein